MKAQLFLTGLLIALHISEESEVLQSDVLHAYSVWYGYSGGTAIIFSTLAKDKELPTERAKQIIDDYINAVNPTYKQAVLARFNAIKDAQSACSKLFGLPQQIPNISKYLIKIDLK